MTNQSAPWDRGKTRNDWAFFDRKRDDERHEHPMRDAMEHSLSLQGKSGGNGRHVKTPSWELPICGPLPRTTLRQSRTPSSDLPRAAAC